MSNAPSICVMGLGYIGLPTASFLATKGFFVLGVDVRSDVVETVRQGKVPIVEPDLDILVKSAVHSGQLEVATEPQTRDIYILAVPTPFYEDSHKPNLSYVEAATRAIAPHLQADALVILESTSPVGTTELVAKIIDECRPDFHENHQRFYVAHCPERVLPGRILYELVNNDRVVGGVDPESTQRAADFYHRFVRGEVLETDARSAEMAKLVENAFRDTNIAFANELSIVSDRLGLNVWEVIRLANHHPRVNVLSPGAGVGGHCIAVDPWFIVSSAPEHTPLMRTARQVNDGKADWVCDRVLERARRFNNPVVSCLGLAYKADIDDLRESPALEIVRRLSRELDGELLVVEPNLDECDEFTMVELDEALRRADVVVALVSHRQFKRVDPEFLKERVLIDACGAFR
jgi:UDP-N-acetyl-D-mannosaminuronic acid dehydrogenase